MRTCAPILLFLLFLPSCSDERTVLADAAPDGAISDGSGADKTIMQDKTSLDDTGPPPDKAGPTLDLTEPADAAISDASGSFPYTLDGIWLVGWIGGLNRFSWVKFQATSPSSGKAWILDGKGLSGGTVPYWNCSGATTWNITSKPGTLQLQMPDANCNGYKSSSYTFSGIKAMTASYPKGATHQATVTAYQGSTPAQISGYKFPASQCDAAMAKCIDPL